MPRLHVVDGSSYIFRAYWAIRTLTNAAGDPTNAIYGVAQMLDKMIADEQPEYLAAVFDAEGPTFRNDIHPDYKAHRPPPPEDLVAQISGVYDVVDGFGIKRFVVPGVEADDVIATLTRMARDHEFSVVLITGDKDLMQLVDGSVSMFEPMKNQRFDAAGVEAKLGVPPQLVAQALALAGDSTDNVPGVPGVGLKTAARLLDAHASLEGVLDAAQAGDVKGKMGQRLVEAVDEARLSLKLVTLRDDLDLGLSSLEDLRYQGPDRQRLHEIYAWGEFERLLDKLEREADFEAGDAAASMPKTDARFEPVEAVLIDTREGLDRWLSEVDEQLSVRIEADGLRALDAVIHGIALASPDRSPVYVPCDSVPWSSIRSALTARLEAGGIDLSTDAAKLLVGATLGSDQPALSPGFDSTLAGYLLEPDDTDHGVELLARRYLGFETTRRAEALGRGRNKKTFDQLDAPTQTTIAGEAVQLVQASATQLPPMLEAENLDGVLYDLEMPLVPVLARMERAGVKVDVGALASMSRDFEVELERLEVACHEAAQASFNIGSTKQLEKILFEDLGLKIVKRTSTGRPSTDQTVLDALRNEHPLPSLILEYRQVQKLKSTYIDALPRMVSSVTGRVHSTFNQAMAATGRLSSMDPNLQNIPIRTELGRKLRRAFIAEDGFDLISVDYSHIELRVLAHLSRDVVLSQAFQDQADVHTRTASVLFEIPPEDVTTEQRTQAKAVNFGVLYGMGPVRLARELDIPRKVASKFVSDYFERQPGVRKFIDDTLEQARLTGEVRTLLGRRRKVPDLKSRNRGARSAAERVATNTPVQGSAADLIKLAMLRVDAMLADASPRSKLILQVHDELLVEAPREEAPQLAARVKAEMEAVFPLAVPLVAEASVGPSWHEAH